MQYCIVCFKMVWMPTDQHLMAGGLGLGVEQDLLAGKPSELPRNLLLQMLPFTSQTEDLLGVIHSEIQGRD